MLCSSYLCSGFFSATPDAYSALCLVLHCTAPLDVRELLTRMARSSKSHHIHIFKNVIDGRLEAAAVAALYDLYSASTVQTSCPDLVTPKREATDHRSKEVDRH